MSELTLTVIKLGFLAVLWLLVLSVTSAVRADLFGVRPSRGAREPGDKPARQPRPTKGAPTRVVVVDGPAKNTAVALGEAPITVGRSPDCTLPVDDEYVSTRHARLVPRDGQWWVEDLGSTNGTYIGKERITRAVPVGTKSRVRLGKTVLELRK
ncbi:MAG TPA: FHA domain-containing protein [Jiangellales bacterium]|nr:FHA domain-containing protein [Jiangellales bacterium]